jgi:hypothetical protein
MVVVGTRRLTARGNDDDDDEEEEEELERLPDEVPLMHWSLFVSLRSNYLLRLATYSAQYVLETIFWEVKRPEA